MLSQEASPNAPSLQNLTQDQASEQVNVGCRQNGKNVSKMSESRRANAAYQPEIDEMIFDYLLYYAIKSQLELSNLEHLDDENSLEDEDYQLDVRLTAERLLTAFNGTSPMQSLPASLKSASLRYTDTSSRV